MPHSAGEISEFSGREIVNGAVPATTEDQHARERLDYPDAHFPHAVAFVEAETTAMEDFDLTDDPVIARVRQGLPSILSESGVSDKPL